MMVKVNRSCFFSFSSYSSVLKLSYMIVSDELRSFEKLLHVIFIKSTIIQLAVGVELLAIRFCLLIMKREDVKVGYPETHARIDILRLVSLILLLTDLLLDVFLVGIVKSRC